MMDMDKLSKWLADSRIDPNDPANSELVYLLRVKFMYDIYRILLLGHGVFSYCLYVVVDKLNSQKVNFI